MKKVYKYSCECGLCYIAQNYGLEKIKCTCGKENIFTYKDKIFSHKESNEFDFAIFIEGIKLLGGMTNLLEFNLAVQRIKIDRDFINPQ